MNYVNGQFVVLPRFLHLNTLNIKYTDILTYVAMRSFDGDDGCFPCYESIAKRANCSRDFIIKSIKRLEKARIVKTKRNRKRVVKDRNPVNHYEFTSSYEFERIPYDIFEADLSLNDKAMLINLRQFFKKTFIIPFHNLKTIAKALGLTYKIVHQRVDSLIQLGYIIRHKREQKVLGFTYKYELTNQVNWEWDFAKNSLLKAKGKYTFRLD